MPPDGENGRSYGNGASGAACFSGKGKMMSDGGEAFLRSGAVSASGDSSGTNSPCPAAFAGFWQRNSRESVCHRVVPVLLLDFLPRLGEGKS